MALSANQKSPSIRIGIVVGEESGDILGAGLMVALQKHFPDAVFEGIGGPRMLALGFHSLFAQDRLAVMGFVDPLKRLPELLGIRKSLKNHFLTTRPDAFIGIDAPDFNLGLEKSLREKKLFTVHYVSPSVWAWRQGRIKTIAKAVDLMLTLLPFEKSFYDEHGVRAEFVGHPLADDIPMQSDQGEARGRCNLPKDAQHTIVALLPGSRGGEVERLAPVFLAAARKILLEKPDALFLIPAANDKRFNQLEQILKNHSDLPLHLLRGQSQDIMAAADVVLMASGTTSLEALLLKRPMVIAYKMAWLSFWIMSKLAKVRYVGLPNLLADKQLVPELLQDDATPEALSQAVLQYLNNPKQVTALQHAFSTIHSQLKQNASEVAAGHIAQMILKSKSRS